MLVFFITILGLAAGLVVAGIALARKQPGRAAKAGQVLGAWIGIYAAVLLLTSFASQPRRLDPGQERCFDEMCYSVKLEQITPEGMVFAYMGYSFRRGVK